MRAKAKLIVLLATVVAGSGSVILAPTTAAATVGEVLDCPNTSCYGGPFCTYDSGWACFLGPIWCDGNERCS
jgi:hypothetical protein